MRIPGLVAKWTLGCAAVSLLALAPTDSIAGPGDPETRPSRPASRADVDWGHILGLQMSEGFRTRGDLFIPRGQEIAGRNREARDNRRAARRGQAPGVELAGVELGVTALPGLGDLSASVSPIPEPTSILLFAAGAGVIALIARRKLAS